MTLAVQELVAGVPLAQTLVTPPKNVFVEVLRPHLVRYGSPAGTLQMLVLDSTNTQIAASNVLTISSLAPTFGYAHGYWEFDVNAGLKANQSYTFKLVSGGGYSFSESAYVGWVNGCDLGKYSPTTAPPNLLQWPLDIEVWHRKQT